MAVKITGNTLGHDQDSGLITVAHGAVTVAPTASLTTGDLHVSGNLFITKAINSTVRNETTLTINDKLIIVGSGTTTDSDLSGGGLQIGSNDSNGDVCASFLYDDTLNTNNGGFDFNLDGVTEASLSGLGLVVAGTVNGDDDDARTIFASMSTAGQGLTLGGGAKVVAGGDLQLAASGLINDSNGDARFTATNAGDTVLGAADGTAGLTLAADNSDVTIAGDLVVSGGKVTLTNGSTVDSESNGILLLTEDVVKTSAALRVGNNIIQASDGGTAITLDTDDNVTIGNDLKLGDDNKIIFGANSDASFEYDEDGNDVLLYAGASMRFGDDIKLEFGAAGDASIEYDEDGTDQLRITAPAAGVVIGGTTPTLVIGDGDQEDMGIEFNGNAVDYFIKHDDSVDALVFGTALGGGALTPGAAGDAFLITSGALSNAMTTFTSFTKHNDSKFSYYGSDSDYLWGYNHSAGCQVLRAEVANQDFKLVYSADVGADQGDSWMTQIAADDKGKLSWGNDIASKNTFVTHFGVEPAATVANSYFNISGNLRVGVGANIGTHTGHNTNYLKLNVDANDAASVVVPLTLDSAHLTQGALVVSGGMAVQKKLRAGSDLHVSGDAFVGDDLSLSSNSAVFNMGSAQQFTLTHANSNNTALVSSGHRLAFGHADEHITGDGTDLSIVSSADILFKQGSNTIATMDDQGLTMVDDATRGQIIANGFTTRSDREIKKNIKAIDNRTALSKVMSIDSVEYIMKKGDGRKELGFIAQDVAKVAPEICALDAQGNGRGIDYSKMSTLLVGAVKQQQAQIEQLKELVAKLTK